MKKIIIVAIAAWCFIVPNSTLALVRDKTYNAAQDEIRRSRDENVHLRNENSTLRKNNDVLQKQLEQTQSNNYIYRTLTIVLGVILLIVVALPFFFVFKSRRKIDNTPPMVDETCPRCGSPIDPSTKQCTNPNCGTRV